MINFNPITTTEQTVTTTLEDNSHQPKQLTSSVPTVKRNKNPKSNVDENGLIVQVYDGLSKRFKTDYAPTTLKDPALESFKHLKKCLINQTI